MKTLEEWAALGAKPETTSKARPDLEEPCRPFCKRDRVPYTLDTLLAICGLEGEKIKLPMDGADIGLAGLAFYELKDSGVFLKRRDARLFAGEQEMADWHPRHPRSTERWDVPVLPFPFTDHELAAFYSDGGGSLLRHLDPRSMSAQDAREAHVCARWLCRQAERLHGPPRRDTAGLSLALQSLLTEVDTVSTEPRAEPEVKGPFTAPPPAPPAAPQPLVHSTRGVRSNILTAVIDDSVALAGGEVAEEGAVWAHLERMARASNPPPPLVDASDAGIVYDDGAVQKTLTRSALGDRLRRRRAKAR